MKTLLVTAVFLRMLHAAAVGYPGQDQCLAAIANHDRQGKDKLTLMCPPKLFEDPWFSAFKCKLKAKGPWTKSFECKS